MQTLQFRLIILTLGTSSKGPPSDPLTTKEVSFLEIGIGDQGELLIHGVNISTFGSIDVGHCRGTIAEILYF